MLAWRHYVAGFGPVPSCSSEDHEEGAKVVQPRRRMPAREGPHRVTP